MFKAFRFFYSTLAGIVLALTLVIAVELLSSVVHPLPPEFTGTEEEMCQHVARYPSWVLGVVLVIWAGIAFISTWVAGRLGNLVPALIVGTLVIAAVACNVLNLPYPWWFSAGNLVCIPLAVLLALRSIARPPSSGRRCDGVEMDRI